MNKLTLFTLICCFVFVQNLYCSNNYRELKCDDLSFYVNSGKIKNVKISTEYDSLDTTQLVIKTISDSNFVSYITLPDGGDILVNTGDSSDIEQIKGEISSLNKSGIQYGVMKMLGWKPRIDWLIFTSDIKENTGGLLQINDSFEIKEFILSPETGIAKTYKNNMLEFHGTQKVDLMQTASPVSLNITLLPKGKFSKNSLSIKCTFNKFSFSFLMDLSLEELEKVIKSSPPLADSTVLFTNAELNDELLQKIDSVFVVKQPQKLQFITDGRLLYLEVPQEIEEEYNSIVLKGKKQK